MFQLKRLNKWLWQGKPAVGIVLLIAPLYLPPAQVLFVRLFNPSSSAPRFFDHFRKDSAGQPVKRQKMTWLAMKDAPPSFLNGVLTAEDTEFYKHHGFDWEEIKISLANSKATGKPVRGASTITQQCARSLFLWQGRSWLRKGLEAYYTMWMELLGPHPV